VPKPQSSKDLALPLRDDPVGKQQLAALIIQCFDALKLFGKEPEQLKNAAALFQFALADYPVEKINDAFKAHLQRSTEMPTPADICTLIRRGNKPPFNQSLYISLVQKRERTSFKENGKTWDCLDAKETDYIREYEEFQLNG
jgi:hypothetical protein